MIDIISGGRVICGFVRGLGQESMSTNVNPVHNRERFEEAHDLIIKAWTTPGPFRWEGKHYEYRVVNPWMIPLQKPHPPIWIPGVSSPESIVYAAKKGYTYVALAPPMALAGEIFDLYDDAAEQEGFTPTPENRGFVVRVAVSDTDERAYEDGKHFYWQLGTSFGVSPLHWQTPPGYRSRAAAESKLEAARDSVRAAGGAILSYEEAQATYQVVTGNPDTVIKRLKDIIDVTDPAHLVIWGREGNMSHETAMRSIDLMGQEVIPALKDYRSNRGEAKERKATAI